MTAKDITMATLVEDIINLTLLFHMCTFCPISEDTNHVSYKLSLYALGTIKDERLILT